MRTIINFLSLALMLIGLVSCSKETSIVDLTVNNKTLEIAKGEIAKILVETGNGKYRAESSNNMIAKVAVSGTTIAILGMEGGSASVTITDEQGKTETINVDVSYNVPGRSTFIWNKESTEFDNAGGYGISILESSVALTDFNESKQFLLSWEGGMTVGDKTNGKLIIADPEGRVDTFELASVTVVIAEEIGGYIVFNDGRRGGELFFSK